jgi:hypothetical protein
VVPQRKAEYSKLSQVNDPSVFEAVFAPSEFTFHCLILSVGSGTNSTQTLFAVDDLRGLVPVPGWRRAQDSNLQWLLRTNAAFPRRCLTN